MFAQADASTVHGVLAAAGFADSGTEPHTPAIRFGTTVTEAIDFLADYGSGRVILETQHDPDHGVMLEAAGLPTTVRTQP